MTKFVRVGEHGFRIIGNSMETTVRENFVKITEYLSRPVIWFKMEHYTGSFICLMKNGNYIIQLIVVWYWFSMIMNQIV